ncbi:helix-turn-helix domain-containing protein [Gracilibacillus xinjiangensis]|uniref:Helix-turn-helix domain-containing protein n=1 Tax=Gracilibacillus xinjiangensis TaxID=1193282 RepID=A0ABV8WYG7_9BACI
MGIGERLKQEREAKNLTLNDIQKQTKIQTRYLNAIEEEKFEVMPGSFYVRAFIKEYATVLELDPEALMTEYESDLPFDKEEKVVLSRVNSSKKNKAVTKTPVVFSFLPSVIVVLLVIGIIVIVWLFRQGAFDGNDPNTSDQLTEQTDESPGSEVRMPPDNGGDEQTNDDPDGTSEDSDTQQETETETSITLDSFADNDLNYTLETNEEQLTLVLETTGQNWIDLQNENGESFVYETLTANNSPIEVDISDFKQVYVKFGEPLSVSFSVNGTPIELPAELSDSTIPQEMWINIVK